MVQKGIFILINLIFGSMVLLSYYYGLEKLKSMDKNPSVLWGGVPEVLQPGIIVFMFIGAIGYFLFTYNFLFNVSTDKLFLGKFSYSNLHLLYLLVFIPSNLTIKISFPGCLKPDLSSIFEGCSFSFCNHLIPGFNNLSSKSLRDLTFTCPFIP